MSTLMQPETTTVQSTIITTPSTPKTTRSTTTIRTSTTKATVSTSTLATTTSAQFYSSPSTSFTSVPTETTIHTKVETNAEPLLMLSNMSAKNATENCNDYDCKIETIETDMCLIPVKNDNDINCVIPCHLSNCSFEIEMGNVCPQFICIPKILPTSTSSPTTPSPEPPGPNHHVILGLEITGS